MMVNVNYVDSRFQKGIINIGIVIIWTIIDYSYVIDYAQLY